MYGIDAFETVYSQLTRIDGIIKENNFKTKIFVTFRTNSKDELINSQDFKEFEKKFTVIDVKDHFFDWNGLIKKEDLPVGAYLDIIDNSDKKNDCIIPYANFTIAPDGSVRACGCLDWNGTKTIGNMQTQSISEIWQNEMAIRFRKGFSTEKIPAMCKTCGLYMEKDRRFQWKSLANYSVTDGLYYMQNRK